MSINPMPSSVYRPATQPRPHQPKFGSGDGGQASDFPETKEALADQFRKQAQDLKIQSDKLERLATSLDGKNPNVQADPASQSENTVPAEKSAQAGEVGASAQTAHEPQDGDDPAPTENPERPNWTPKEKRSRWNVAVDLGKHYFTRGKVISDLLWSIGIGAVCAIGSPVMAVTIPTTMAVFGGMRLLLLGEKMLRDPKGDHIDKMYQKWIKADKEKAQKAAE